MNAETGIDAMGETGAPVATELVSVTDRTVTTGVLDAKFGLVGAKGLDAWGRLSDLDGGDGVGSQEGLDEPGCPDFRVSLGHPVTRDARVGWTGAIAAIDSPPPPLARRTTRTACSGFSIVGCNERPSTFGDVAARGARSCSGGTSAWRQPHAEAEVGGREAVGSPGGGA